MKRLFYIMEGVNNGVCPICGKGPIEITLNDISKFIIDESGIPIISRTTQVKSVGKCLNCGKEIGEYVRDLFVYRRPSGKKLDIKPKETIKINPFMK